MLRAEQPPEQLAALSLLPLHFLPLQLFPPHGPWLAFFWLRVLPLHAISQPSLGAVRRNSSEIILLVKRRQGDASAAFPPCPLPQQGFESTVGPRF